MLLVFSNSMDLMASSENRDPLDKYVISGPNVTVGELLPLDVSLTGGSIKIGKNAVIEGHANIDGDNINISGRLMRGLNVAGSRLVISGLVAGDIHADVDTLIIKSGAQIEGNVNTTGKLKKYFVSPDADIDGEVFISSGAVREDFIDELTEESKEFFEKTFETFQCACASSVIRKMASVWQSFYGVLGAFGLAGISGFFIWFSTFLIGFLLYMIAPRFTWQAVEMARLQTGRCFGLGVFALLATPIAFLILILTIIGIPLAFVLGFLVMLIFAVGKIIGIWLVGNLGLRLTSFKETKSGKLRITAFALAIPVVGFISVIPILGWLFLASLFLIGFGSVFTTLFQRHPL